jgi:hypothetical protein
MTRCFSPMAPFDNLERTGSQEKGSHAKKNDPAAPTHCPCRPPTRASRRLVASAAPRPLHPANRRGDAASNARCRARPASRPQLGVRGTKGRAVLLTVALTGRRRSEVLCRFESGARRVLRAGSRLPDLDWESVRGSCVDPIPESSCARSARPTHLIGSQSRRHLRACGSGLRPNGRQMGRQGVSPYLVNVTRAKLQDQFTPDGRSAETPCPMTS